MLLICNFITFAQPNPDPTGGDPDPSDAPLDSYVYVLIAVAICYVAFKLYYKKVQIFK